MFGVCLGQLHWKEQQAKWQSVTWM